MSIQSKIMVCDLDWVYREKSSPSSPLLLLILLYLGLAPVSTVLVLLDMYCYS